MSFKIIIGSVLVLFFLSNISFSQDVDGSKDHPLITRYPGSFIKVYEENNFREYWVATGPETGYKNIDEWIETKGQFTRIYYELEGTVTLSEIYGNYLSALEKEGFEILAKGNHPSRNVLKEVGGGSWLGTYYDRNKYENNDIRLGHGTATAGGTCYIAAKLTRGSGTVYVTLGGREHSAERKIFMVDIIEEKPMEDGLVQVDANAMLRQLQAEGSIALYGIYFDTDKVDVKPESEYTLKEIVSLLNNNRDINVYIVGHTDIRGTLEHNMELALGRATNVSRILQTAYQVDGERIIPKGVGPLAPVATNDTDAGMQKNRRVELVLR
jgi:OOP family OmpA-OmpF porin